MAPDPPFAGGLDRQQPTGNGSGKGRQWLARDCRRSHGDDKGRQREQAVDDRAGGWTKDWMGNDRVTVAVVVAAVATADVVTETAMPWQ